MFSASSYTDALQQTITVTVRPEGTKLNRVRLLRRSLMIGYNSICARLQADATYTNYNQTRR